MSKILLINPPFQRLKGIENSQFNLGLGYLAAVALQDNHQAAIYDMELLGRNEQVNPPTSVSLFRSHSTYTDALSDDDHPVWKEAADILDWVKPDIVGLTVLTPTYGSARKITVMAKAQNPRCAVIWGGVHPTFMAQDVLEKVREIDFVVRGEGEYTFRELLSGLARKTTDYHRIDGLSFRKGSTIVHNGPRERIRRLDELPFPARDALINRVSNRRIYSNLMGSRGCPYACTYCASAQFWGEATRFRTIPNIVQEIETLKADYGVTNLEFWDDSFTLKRDWAIELCDAMQRNPMHLSWWCNTRANLIDEEILKRMKKAGCTTIHVGMESGSDRILSDLNRKLTIEQMLQASDLLSRQKVNWCAYFMVGFPNETLEDLEKTRRLMRTIGATGIEFNVFNPYPGTKLYEQCREMNLLPENPDWSLFSHQSPENHFMRNVSKMDFERIVEQIAEECDGANSRLVNRLKRITINREFYLKNPRVLAAKLKEKMRKRKCARGKVSAPVHERTDFRWPPSLGGSA